MMCPPHAPWRRSRLPLVAIFYRRQRQCWAKRGNATAKNNEIDSGLGFESELWHAADAVRSSMDASEYKHVVLGLIFLNYISDAFVPG